jgi:hypothetical protein
MRSFFYFEAVYLQTSWCHKGIKCLTDRQLSTKFMVVTTILFTHTTFLWATCCLTCFITIVKPFLTLILTTVHTVYLIRKKGSRRVWSIDRGCLLIHGTWSHLWYIQRSVCACSPICISYRTYYIEYCSLFLSFHIINLILLLDNEIMNYENAVWLSIDLHWSIRQTCIHGIVSKNFQQVYLFHSVQLQTPNSLVSKYFICSGMCTSIHELISLKCTNK